MLELPTGTITFLFTDVEGSSRPWEEHPQAMRAAMARHDALLTQVFEAHDGIVVRPRGEGDSLFAVFVRATDAVAGALAGQRALAAEDWGVIGPLRVRMALHTGEADLREGDYYGSAVNRCARIRAAGHGGQVLVSQATATLVREGLPNDAILRFVGAYRLRDLSQTESLYQLAAPDLPADFPPLRTLESRPNNLPLQLTSFIGRERELADIARLLAESRLLTLTGAGGTGKTRLALQAAAAALDAFPDGVFFVDLAPLRDPGLVAQTVARALGLRDVEGRTPQAVLMTFLRDRWELLVLDNFEHLLDAAVLVTELLPACPYLQVLVTSREALRLTGEYEYPVPPLPLPASDHETSVLGESAAVALFAERARAIRPDFRLTDETAATVAAICARLDGLPLAIELAAARTRLLPPRALLARLGERTAPLTLLTGGMRDRPQRQRTLQDAIAWSHDLLTPAERVLFRRVAVFVGGCPLDAAEVVCGDAEGLDGGTIADSSVLELAGSLAEKSLLRPIAGDEPRLTLLETIREFAAEQLAAAGEEPELRRRHVAYMLAFVERGDMSRRTAAARLWLQLLDAEQDNVHAALASTVLQDDVAAGARFLTAMRWYWTLRGQAVEARHWCEEMLALPSAVPRSHARAEALVTAAFFARVHGDHVLAHTHAEESVAICRERGDGALLATALVELSHLVRSDPALAHRLLEESLALCRGLDNRWGAAMTLLALARLARREGDSETARPLLEQALAILRESGDAWIVSWPLLELAQMDAERGATRHALNQFDESLQLFREMGAMADISDALPHAIVLRLWEGRTDGVGSLLAESLQVSYGIGAYQPVPGALEVASAVAYQGSQWERAVRLLGAAAGLREAQGGQRPTAYRAQLDGMAASLRRRLGEEAFEATWTEGHRLSIEHAVADVRALATELEAEAGQSGAQEDLRVALAAPVAPTDGLSAREVEVLRLIAAGKRDREIAEALVISRNTVIRHVSNIFDKIGATNRTEAAAYAFNHGLTM